MPFTEISADDLRTVLIYMNKCEMPIEFFDALLFEYANSKDLGKAINFARSAWDL